MESLLNAAFIVETVHFAPSLASWHAAQPCPAAAESHSFLPLATSAAVSTAGTGGGVGATAGLAGTAAGAGGASPEGA